MSVDPSTVTTVLEDDHHNNEKKGRIKAAAGMFSFHGHDAIAKDVAVRFTVPFHALLYNEPLVGSLPSAAFIICSGSPCEI